LGENAILLCGIKFYREEKKRALEDSERKKGFRDKKSDLIKTEQDDNSMDNKRKSALVVSPPHDPLQDLSDSKRKPQHINTSLLKIAADPQFAGSRGGFLTSRPINPEETTKIVPDETELPPGMSNPVLRTVIMRLQYSVAFGSWEVRLVCLRALAKIAFLSNFEVKLHLYSFFQTICKDNSVGLAAEASPILSTLHKIFLAFSEYVKMGTNLTQAKKTELNDEIKQYCNIPENFHPLGIYTTLKKTVKLEEPPAQAQRHSVSSNKKMVVIN